MNQFISKEILDELSYKSTLGRSLKQISLSKTSIETIVNDIGRYRAIHLYYQRDNMAYPIEVQLWCGEDYRFNIWSHRWAYKYQKPEFGKALYELYKQGKIENEEQFINVLKEMGGKVDA